VIAQNEAEKAYALGNPTKGRYECKRGAQDEQQAEELRCRIGENCDFDKISRLEAGVVGIREKPHGNLDGYPGAHDREQTD